MVKKAVAKKVTPKKKAVAKKAVVKKAPAPKKTVAKKPPVAKKAAGAKPVAKKTSAAGKAAPKTKKAVVKKAAPKAKAVVKKAPGVKKAATKKVSKASAKKKAAAEQAVVVKLPPRKFVRPSEVQKKPEPVASKSRSRKLRDSELKKYRNLLVEIRTRITDQIAFLAGDNLNRSARDSSGDLSSYSFHMADQGTDNFDREFALNLVSSEQDVLYEVDAALRRIEDGTYGICELSGDPIERERLDVLPYARYSVKSQSEMEKGRKRFRPFGSTMTHR